MSTHDPEGQLVVHDYEPSLDTFYTDVLAGLRQKQKCLPSKYFYDDLGSQLFNQICELDEYYLTRAELSIMDRYAHEMAAAIGPHCRLVEFGSGSSIKTRLLLDELEETAAYVPVDIARDHLEQVSHDLSQDYADLEVLPVCADFMEPLELPSCRSRVDRTLIYFPGSTIGNLDSSEAQRLLANIAAMAGPSGGLLIGLDLQKDPQRLRAAYNDALGVTAQFNLNLLARINRELDGDFQLNQFEHRAIYNTPYQRIEMHLVSLQRQVVSLGGETIEFAEGETILTEYSHKYNLEQFDQLAAVAGLRSVRSWTDDDRLFAVVLMQVVAPPA